MPIMPMLAYGGCAYWIEVAGYPDLARAAFYFGSALILTAIYLKDD